MKRLPIDKTTIYATVSTENCIVAEWSSFKYTYHYIRKKEKKVAMSIFFNLTLNPQQNIVNKKQSIVNKNINVCFAISKNSYIFAMYFIINEFFRW